MATFNINHTGLPTLLARTDNYTLIEADWGAAETLGYHTFNVLANDDLGALPTTIIDFDETPGLGTIQIAPDGLSLRVLHPFERISNFYSLAYTIKDAFNRESTGIVNITVTIT